RTFGGAAGGDQVIDQDHAVALGYRVLVHLHLVDAVFERISDGDALVGQLALLADRHEAGRYLVRDRAAEDEAARLDAGDLVDLASRPGLHQLVDRAAEGARIAQQRRDVAEHDPGLGIVRDSADRSAQVVFDGRRGHDKATQDRPKLADRLAIPQESEQAER